jgi:hypothetical protein
MDSATPKAMEGWKRVLRLQGRENFIGDKISINPIIPFIAEVR